MASNEIRYRLRLDDDEFKSKIDDAASHGKNAFKDIHETLGKAGGAEAGEGFGKKFESIFDKVKDKFHEKLQEANEGGHGAAHKIRETIHTVHPIIEEAELGGLGKLGAFALAARAGISSLAIALGGTLVAALEKLTDETTSRIARLSSLAGSSHLGKEAEESLGRSADQLKLPASKLAPAQEELVRANQAQPENKRIDEKAREDALASAVNLAVAGGANREDAVAPLAQLFKSLRDNGGLTQEAGEAGLNALPGLKGLLEELQKKNPNAPGGFHPTPEVLKTLQGLGPQAAKAAAGDGTSSIPDAWSHVGRSTEALAERVTGGHLISSTLDRFADGIEGATKAWDKIVYAVRNSTGIFDFKWPSEGDLHRKAPTKEQLDKLPDVGAPPIDKATDFLGKALFNPGALKGHEAGDTAADGSHLDKVADGAHAAAEALHEVAKNSEEVIAAQKEDRANLDRMGAKNATAQAKLDYEYKPAENDIKLGRDQIAVENAQLSVQQSLLSATQSQKAVAQSKLAPETAQENVNSAESNWRKALHRFHELRGVRDNYNPQQEALWDSSDALDAAATAVKRAKIEKRYAYLEEPKAKLAAEKTKTDIRSAEFLERDSKLALAKDKRGNVLSEEVTGIRYADASLRETLVINKNTASAAQTLKQILAKISGQSDKDKSGKQQPDEQKRDQEKRGERGEQQRGEQQRGRRAGSGASGDTAGDATEAADKATADAAREAREAKELYRRYGQINVKPGGLRELSPDEVQSYGSPAKAEQLNERDKIARSGRVDDEFGKLSTNKAGQALNDTARSGFAKRPRDQYDANRETQEWRDDVKWGADQQNDFTRSIREQVGGRKPFDRMGLGSPAPVVNDDQQRGIVRHPNGGKADLSERLYPGGPLRYRYNPDPGYQPFEAGHYNEDQQWVPNKKQPHSRLRPHPYASDRPYSKLEDTFDTKGNQDYPPIENFGAPQGLAFPEYNKYLKDKVFPQGGVPQPQPRPPEAPQPGQQSELLGPIQQLSSNIMELNGTIAQSNSAKNAETTNAGNAGNKGANGGEVQEASQKVTELGSDSTDTGNDIKSLGDAAVETASRIQEAGSGSSGNVTAAGGGHIRGPGTSTSDDIDAKLSDGEFVVNSRETSRHLPLLHDINDGKYADGGFVGRLSAMGFNKGGLIEVPHFAIGGPVRGAAPKVDDGGGDNGGAPAGHYSVDLRTNHGDFKMMAPEHVARQMSRAAVASTSVQAGPRPSWYGK